MSKFKKIGIVISVFIAIFLLAAVIVPLVVNVDQYRPKIVQSANERLNGKLELGKLSLSLWGQIRIQIEGLSLADAQGRKVVGVNDAFFHVAFSSIFSGSPLLTLKMDQPDLEIVKDKTGKMNVMTLMKESPAQTPAGTPSAGAPSAPSEPMNIPAIATRTRLGVEMTHAKVTYKDELSGLNTSFKDLNMVLKDISLSRPTEIAIWGEMDTTLGKTLSVKGPIRIDGQAQPTLADGKFQKATLQFKANADDLEIISGTLFHKKKGIPAHVEGTFESTPDVATIKSLITKFHNAEVSVSGQISQLGAPASAAGVKPSPVVQLLIKSNEIELKPWSDLVPMLKEYELGGTAGFNANVEGPADKLGYQADLAVKALTAKSVYLKTEPRMDASVHVVTDKIEKMLLTMKAPGNDLKIEGSLVSFTQPKANFQVTSTGMDLDEMINLPPLGAKAKVKHSAATADQQTPGNAGGTVGAPAAEENYDALLQPLRENKLAVATTANVGLNLAFIKVYGIKMSEINSKLSMSDLVATINSFGMKVWGGTLGANMSMDLKPKAPTYRFAAAVSGLDLKQAVASQMQLLKDTVLGTAAFKMEGSGVSFNPTPAKSNLNAKGNMKIEKATFATIDVGKMATDAVNKAIDRVAEKIPAVKGKGVKGLPGGASRYEVISSDFTIAGGKFSAPNFIARAEKNAGIDLNGNTTVGMVDYSLKAAWELVDTYNLTHARDISVSQNGVNVEHLLAEKDKPVRFPVEVGCTVTAPCYSYTQVPEFLAKVAFNNATGAVTGKAKAEVQKRTQQKVEELSRKAPAPVQNAIKGLGKKLFGG